MKEDERHGFALTGFRRGIAFTSSGSLLNIGFLFAEMVVAVRFLSTEAYGLYVLLISVANFLVMVSDFGFKTGVTQMLAAARPESRPTIAFSAVLFRLTISAVIVALLWPALGLLGFLAPTNNTSAYVAYLPLLFVVASLDELLNGILQGFQRYRNLAIALAGRSVLRFALTFTFLLVLQLGVLALVFSWILTFALSAAYQFLSLPISKRPVLSRASTVSLLRFGFPLQITRYLWFAFYQINVLLLGALAGPASVAFYAVAARIPEAFERLFESFIAVFFPSASALIAAGRRGEADWVLNRSLRLISFATSLAAMVGVLFGDTIISLVFSEKYAASGTVFGVLMVALQMSFLISLMGYALTAAGYPARSLAANTSRAVINVVADLVLIPVLGTLGPAVAGLVACHATNPFAVWLLRRSSIGIQALPYTIQATTLLLCAGLVWLEGVLGLVAPGVHLVFALSVLGLFVGANVALKSVSREDFDLLLPGSLRRRTAVPKESIPYGHG